MKFSKYMFQKYILYIRDLGTAVTKRIEFNETKKNILNKERSILLYPWIWIVLQGLESKEL